MCVGTQVKTDINLCAGAVHLVLLEHFLLGLELTEEAKLAAQQAQGFYLPIAGIASACCCLPDFCLHRYWG